MSRVEIELVSIAGHANKCTIQTNSVPMSLVKLATKLAN